MLIHARRAVFVVLVSILGAAAAQPVQAQQTPAGHQQVVSANPFGLLLEFFNAEYERIVTESSTAGIGGRRTTRGPFGLGRAIGYVGATRPDRQAAEP